MDALLAALSQGGDVQPIPVLPRPPPPCSKSRRCQRRHLRALSLWVAADRTRTTLNQLLRPGPVLGYVEQPVRIRNSTQDANTRAIWTRLLQECKRLEAGRRVSRSQLPTGAALMARVLKNDCADIYSRDRAKNNYENFIADNIVEPTENAPVVKMVDALPRALLPYYFNFDKLLRSAAEVDEVKAAYKGRYEKVMGQRREWVRYLNRGDIRHLWELRPASETRFRFSVAAVAKKQRPWLRKLVQCVPLNDAILTPAELLGMEDIDYGLVGATAVAQASGLDDVIAACTLDESNAFSHVETPPSWWPYMGGPTVYAKELPREWRDPAWPPNLLIGPQYRRLGMGFSHAVFILQFINLAGARRAVREARLWEEHNIQVFFLNMPKDRRTRLDLQARGPRAVGLYIHLDDFITVAASLVDAARVLDVIDLELQRLGFLTTRANLLEDAAAYVGFVLQRRPLRWQPEELRLGNLDRALEIILSLRVVPVATVHTLLSIFVWLATLWRPAMAVPHSLYVFVRAMEGLVVPLWPTVRRELMWIRGMLPLLYADLGRKPYPVLLAQDASAISNRPGDSSIRGFGAFSLAVTVPPLAELTAVIADVETVGRPSVVPIALGGVRPRLGRAPEVPLLQRTTLPQSWFGEGGLDWQVVLSRKWRRPIEIAAGELTALVVWMKILLAALTTCVRRSEVLALTDNAVVAALVARGRSSRFDLNVKMRRILAVQAIGDCLLRSPWVDTAHQPADDGTREERDGTLYQGPVRWKSRRILLFIAAYNPAMMFDAINMGVVVHSMFQAHHDTEGEKLWSPTARRKLLRLVESGTIASLIWSLPLQTFNYQLVNFIVDVLLVLHRARGAFVVWGPIGHVFWSSLVLLDRFQDLHAQTVIFDVCQLGGSTHMRFKMVGTLRGLESVAKLCSGSRLCRRTGKAHDVRVPRRCPRCPQYVDPSNEALFVPYHGCIHQEPVRQVAPLVARHLAQLVLRGNQRGDCLAEAAARECGDLVGGSQAVDAQDIFELTQ